VVHRTDFLGASRTAGRGVRHARPRSAGHSQGRSLSGICVSALRLLIAAVLRSWRLLAFPAKALSSQRNREGASVAATQAICANHSMASRIIADTIGAGLVKPQDPQSKSRKLARYVPFWA